MPRDCMPPEMSPTERVLLRALEAAPAGMPIVELAVAASGMKVGRTGELLRRLRMRGLIVPIGGSRTRWFTLDHAEAHRNAPPPPLRQVKAHHEATLMGILTQGAGLKTRQAARLLGLRYDHTRTILHRLRDDGRIVSVGRHRAARWMEAGAARALETPPPDAAPAADREDEDDAFLTIRRRLVDAAKCKPLRPRGPVSVFDLCRV